MNDLALKAFEIADNSMLELLESHTIPIDEVGLLRGLVDSEGKEVKHLSEADPAIIEAVEWLRPRDFIEMVDDPDGEVIFVKAKFA